MVVTGSREEVVRYKRAFDQIIQKKGYKNLQAMVAFSGDIPNEQKPDRPFNERTMNPGLKGRDLRKAFDTDEYQVMLVANKFQTGFDQPKLCAMYVDKKLKGVDCVQTLSRLNRTAPGKQTFILDFVNDPEEILEAFRPYYQTAELANVSDPNLIYDLFDKLCEQRIFEWNEVEAFVSAFYDPKRGQDTLTAHCRPAMNRFASRYKSVLENLADAEHEKRSAKARGDQVTEKNTKQRIKELKEEKSALELFKKDLGTFVRFYEFVSQLVDYDDIELEQLSVFAYHLRPLLREDRNLDEVDLSDLTMTHYRLNKQNTQHLKISDVKEDYQLKGMKSLGGGRYKDQEFEFFSEIIARLNELFAGDFTGADVVNYADTIADKVCENSTVMEQLKNNPPEQALLGDFHGAVEKAVIDSIEVHESLARQLLDDEFKAENFGKLLIELLLKGLAA